MLAVTSGEENQNLREDGRVWGLVNTWDNLQLNWHAGGNFFRILEYLITSLDQCSPVLWVKIDSFFTHSKFSIVCSYINLIFLNIKMWNFLFRRNLWITNTVSCGALFVVGDLLQQNLELYNSSNSGPKFDYDRSGNLLYYSLLFSR